MERGQQALQRRFLITGAASGIGKAVAELAADAGHHLCLVDVDEPKLREVETSLREHGARVVSVEADLADPQEPQRAVEVAASHLGGLDVLVSNAGSPRLGLLSSLTVEDFDANIAVNVRATWLLAQASRELLAESQGNVVATGSICGHHAAPPQGGYSIAKAGLLMLVKQLALEWGPEGIRCNSVSPGPTVTGLTEGVFNDMDDPRQRAIREMRESSLPLRKIGMPADVARAIMFLAGPEASQITGIDLLVDGGMSVVLMPAAGVTAGRM